MIRSLVLTLLTAALASCIKEDTTVTPPVTEAAKTTEAKAAETKAPAPAATSTTPAKPAIPDTAAVAGQAKATADAALGEAKKAAASATEAVAVPATTQELQQKIGSFNTDQLKSLADQIVSSLTKNQDLMKSLNDQIAKAGLDLTKVADLKKNLESTKTSADNLIAQLKIVTDKLKASNIDITKYTSFLGSK